MRDKKNMSDADVLAILSNHEYVTQMLQKGIHAALLKHKLAGNAICTSENGKVVWISAENIKLDSYKVTTIIPKTVHEKIQAGTSPLKAWREYRGFSTLELADRVGVSRQYIHQIEHNERTGSIQLLKKISEALGVSLEDIISKH